MPFSVISFRDVYYAYPGTEDYALKGTTFEVTAGSTEMRGCLATQPSLPACEPG